MSTKYLRCSHCKQLLPENAFALNASSETGRQHECRACRKRYYQEGFVPHDRLSPGQTDDVRCPVCKRILPRSAFDGNVARARGLQSMCRECKKEYQRKYYERNPEYQARQRELGAIRQGEIRDYIYNYLLQHPCQVCGETDPLVLTFHHRNGSEKEITISEAVRRQYSQERLEREIAKCIVLCFNCHARVTAKEKGNWRNQRTGTP